MKTSIDRLSMRVKVKTWDHPKKNTTMVEAVYCYWGIALMFPATTTPGASAERVDQGRSGGVLSNYVNQQRKKTFTKLNPFILVFCIYWLLRAPNTMVLLCGPCYPCPYACIRPCLLSFLHSATSAGFYLIIVSITHCHFGNNRCTTAIHWQHQMIPHHQAIASTPILAEIAWELVKIRLI